MHKLPGEVPILGESPTPVSRCGQCGLDIRWVEDGEGTRFPIDARATVMTGDRYYFKSHDPDVVAPMARQHIGYGHGDHRETCPVKMREAHPYGRRTG